MKKRNKKSSLILLICLCVCSLFGSFIPKFKNSEVYALSSWSPSTGFMPGISIDVGGNNGSDLLLGGGNLLGDIGGYGSIFTDNSGVLRSFTKLQLPNIAIDNKYSGWKYLSFVKYFYIVRDDGRPIYDDDGILDVSDTVKKYTDETVNYHSHAQAVTQKMPSDSGGFLWTTRQAKCGADLWIVPISSSGGRFDNQSCVHMPTDPKGETIDLEEIVFADGYTNSAHYISNQCYIGANASCYQVNTFWGGSGDEYYFQFENMTNYFNIGNRDWSNDLTADAVEGQYLGRKAFYSNSPFVAVAKNLNNYLKVNDVQITPIVDANCLPYADGFHIAITGQGITKVSLEQEDEGIFRDYYCFIDSVVPDVAFTFHNTNAMDKMITSEIKTDEETGCKSQTMKGAIFKDEVKISFATENYETPESAVVIHDGITKDFESGTWLYDEGDYELIVTDKVGNTQTVTFTIDKSYSNYNLTRLVEDKTNYKISKWYLTQIPYGQTGYGTYSFMTNEEALEFAIEKEKEAFLSTYELENVEDFQYINLVADNGDENNNDDNVRTGTYWYYKSKSNPNIYLYYFDYNQLMQVIEMYAEDYVSVAQYSRFNESIFPSTYGTVSEDVMDNIWNQDIMPAYISNNFVFKYLNDNETYKIYYDYQGNDIENYVEFVYGKTFASQVGAVNGLFKIKEVDYAGHETYYYVYLDYEAPILDIEAKLYGEDKFFSDTISVKSIPKNGELVYYFENFKITSIEESDKWWVVQITEPNGTTHYYTHEDELPSLEDFGHGLFKINVYDRLKNNFDFQVYIQGKSPSIVFESINTNTELSIKIIKGEEYNTIISVDIYRNDIRLNNVNGYDEYPERDNNELIYINPETLNYIFTKGGNYKVVLTDNFNREIVGEYKFNKDLPKGVLEGVEDGGKTRGNVKFIYNSQLYFITVKKNGESFTPETEVDSTGKLTTAFFNYEEETVNEYQIELINIDDFENYNVYTFTIKRISPEITLFNVEDGGTTATDVWATWTDMDIVTNTYMLNGFEKGTYKKNQSLGVDGQYSITITDNLGNTNTVSFEIDRTLDFFILANDEKVTIEEIEFTNKDIQICKNEPLEISILRNNEDYPYEFEQVLSVEGEYLVTISDVYSNTQMFRFCIDKTPPVVKLVGVENFGLTKDTVWLSWEEEKISATYSINGKTMGTYTNCRELYDTGTYVVYVFDLAQNYVRFDFEIDSNIGYAINIFDTGITNDDVKIYNYEPLEVEVYKDNEIVEYTFGNRLTEHGFYIVRFADHIGNQKQISFTIIKHPIQKLENHFLENISVESILKENEIFEIELFENTLSLTEDGNYQVEVLDVETENKYNFKITIDTIAPTLELVGVENGGKTKKDISTQNCSEDNVTILAYRNDEQFNYQIGEVMKNVGVYKLIVMDEAGNQTIYEFEKTYSLNAGAIALFAGLLAIAVIVAIFIVKSRKGLYVEIEEDND